MALTPAPGRPVQTTPSPPGGPSFANQALRVPLRFAGQMTSFAKSTGRFVAHDVPTHLLPSRDTAALIANEFAFELVSCFVPTFLREMGMSLAFDFLGGSAPHAATGVVGLLTLFKGMMHISAHQRLARDPGEAARGFHGMTVDKWRALSGPERQERVEHCKSAMRMATAMDVLATAASLISVVRSYQARDPDAAAAEAANGVRNALYLTRDLIKGSLVPTKYVTDHPDHPVFEDARTLGRDRIKMLGGLYVALNFAGNYGQSLIIRSILPPELTINGPALSIDQTEQLLGRASAEQVDALRRDFSAAFSLYAKINLARAAVNTGVELVDNLTQKSEMVKLRGGMYQPQRWKVQHDRDRLRDHSAFRFAWNNFSAIAGSLSRLIGDPHVLQFFGNAGRAILLGGTYYPINSLYDAAQLVRVKQKTTENPQKAKQRPSDAVVEGKAPLASLVRRASTLDSLRNVLKPPDIRLRTRRTPPADVEAGEGST